MSYKQVARLRRLRLCGPGFLRPVARPREWLDIEYVDWKSSGDTRFAPIASAYGDMECNGFWNHTPPKTDKDGVWVPKNAELAPRLKARAEEPGANIGRCRSSSCSPTPTPTASTTCNRDDNNRLNPEGTGWIVRGFFKPHRQSRLGDDSA